ncbi:hypothetical protein EP7_005409 [Isosphaeraceae bacterium EP7]
MLTDCSYRWASLALGLGVCLASEGSAASGAAISTWSGASATAGATTETGATASASDAWSRKVEYRGAYDYGSIGGRFVNASGKASAAAGGSPDNLLSVDTHAYAENPGTIEGTSVHGGAATASARWSGDFLTISPPQGMAIPDSVQLHFGIEFNRQSDQGNFWNEYFRFGPATVVANEKTFNLRDYWRDTELPRFDSAGPDSPVGRFHIDLPVNAAGLSAPFSLSLEASSFAVAHSNDRGDVDHRLRLSLLGVTLADGTSLGSLGYQVSFASGLSSPEPVPEPASVAIWTLGAAACIVAARRRKQWN